MQFIFSSLDSTATQSASFRFCRRALLLAPPFCSRVDSSGLSLLAHTIPCPVYTVRNDGHCRVVYTIPRSTFRRENKCQPYCRQVFFNWDLHSPSPHSLIAYIGYENTSRPTRRLAHSQWETAAAASSTPTKKNIKTRRTKKKKRRAMPN